jgi:hypothetical protein
MGNLGVTEIILILIIAMGFGLIPKIFYLITLQNTINEIRPENRRMEPGQVWLSLIPIFGLVWQFIIVANLGDSLKAEFQSRNLPSEEDRPGYSIGLAYCILACVSVIPFVGFLTGIASLVCWIVYWVKVYNFRMMMMYQRRG